MPVNPHLGLILPHSHAPGSFVIGDTQKESRLENKSQEEKRQPPAHSTNFAPRVEVTMDDWVVQESDVSRLVLPAGVRDHAQGSRRATVTLLEYGDLESSRCAEVFSVMKEVTRWLRGELCYVFRHFPVEEKHPNALVAAEAAEAAGAQGQFWQMHDLLCVRSSALDEERLYSYAQELGLDVERFERDMREHTYLDKVREDFWSGIRSGVTRTPAFFINDVRYRGEVELDSLLAAIEEAGNRAISGNSCRKDK